jgi:hypothetical protein
MLKVIAADIEDALDQIERAHYGGLVDKQDRDSLVHCYELVKLDMRHLLEALYSTLDNHNIEETY